MNLQRICKVVVWLALVPLLAAPAQGQTPDTPTGDDSTASLPDSASTNDSAPGDAEPQVASTSIRTPAAPVRRGSAPASAVIREPSQGRPIFITPGETFYFVMELRPELQGEVGFTLRHAIEPSLVVPLRPETPPSYINNEYCSLVLAVPDDVRPGLYDVEVRTGNTSYASRRSVRVVDRFKEAFRFVHLSSMHIGDLTAPEFDEMLSAEINLLAPEFIIATGDYTEWARARDDASSWTRILKFFEQFNAPVFMLCGAHDHEASFTRFVASKPIDTIDYGNYHGLLLLDHPANPIDQDYQQLQWIETDLKKNRNKTFNFIAANSDEMLLLDLWRAGGDLAEMLRDNRVKMYIAGGSSDWDYREFANKLDGIDDFHFIRTHESSTCQRGRATGFSHFRVIDVDGDTIQYVYADDNSTEPTQHSIPTGRLRTFFDAPNDGSSSRVGVTVQNALNQTFDNARVWLRVAKSGNSEPTVAPGRVAQKIDMGHYWACDVEISLPDKGATRVVAAANPSAVPAPVPVTVALDGPAEWRYAAERTDFGMEYFRSDSEAALTFANTSDREITCWPVIRINGTQLPMDRSACPRLPMVLKPGEPVTIPIVTNLLKVSPGRHSLQVYFLEDPLCRLTTFDVTLDCGTRTAAR